jgi:hypothetical protein
VKFLVWLCLWAAQNANADNTQLPLKGGTSPDGTTEIRLIAEAPYPGWKDDGINDYESTYVFGFFHRKAKKPYYTADVGGGYCAPQGANGIDSALWDASGKFVALSDHGTRHSMEIYLFKVIGKNVEKLPLPKYGTKAITDPRSGAGSAWCPVPERWEGTKLIIKLQTYFGISKITLQIFDSATGTSTVKLLTESDPVGS